MKTHFSPLLVLSLFFFLSFTSFAQQFQIVGNSYAINTIQNVQCLKSGQCFTLTDNLQGKKGAVWNLDKLDLTKSFDATFCMFLGDKDAAGADGFAFVMRSEGSKTLGPPGGGLGFGFGVSPDVTSGSEISPSVAIEFDTYENEFVPRPDGSQMDIAADHTALVLNGDLVNQTVVGPLILSANSSNVEDNNFHNCRIVWNVELKKLSFYFDGAFRFEYTNDFVSTVFNGNPKVIWGFTASTGVSINLQQICFPTLDINVPDQSICAGDSTLIHFYKNGLTNYEWTKDGKSITAWNSLLGTPLVDTSFYAKESGTYHLKVEFNNMVFDRDVKLTVIDLPKKPFAIKEVMFCPDSTVYLLNALNLGDSYLWKPTMETTQSIQVKNDGWYSVEIKEPILKCTISDSIFVNFMCDALVELGNVFTPNGDGSNDVFTPLQDQNPKWIDKMSFTVLNRWGEVMYLSTEKAEWNGMSNGNRADEGVYYYLLNYSTVKNKSVELKKQGFVHLLQ